MTDVYRGFDDEMKASFGATSHAEGLKHFYRAMKMKAEMVGRDLVVNDTARLQSQSGELKNLYELADWAGAALSALESEAKGESADGIPPAYM